MLPGSPPTICSSGLSSPTQKYNDKMSKIWKIKRKKSNNQLANQIPQNVRSYRSPLKRLSLLSIYGYLIVFLGIFLLLLKIILNTYQKLQPLSTTS